MTKRTAIQQRLATSGFSLFELIATLALLSILLGIAIPNFRIQTRPLNDASASTEQFLQLVRSRAISGTAVYKVTPLSQSQIQVFTGSTCASATTLSTDLILKLPSGATLTDTTWYVCFNPRGRADAAISFQITAEDGRSKTISVALGGGVKIS